jgi:hypothetical protein
MLSAYRETVVEKVRHALCGCPWPSCTACCPGHHHACIAGYDSCSAALATQVLWMHMSRPPNMRQPFLHGQPACGVYLLLRPLISILCCLFLQVLAPEMKVAVPLDQYTSDPWEEGTLSTKATPQAPSSGRQQPEQQQAQGADDAPSQVLPASVPATQKPSASSNGHIDRIDSTTGNGANLADELTLPSPTRG